MHGWFFRTQLILSQVAITVVGLVILILLPYLILLLRFNTSMFSNLDDLPSKQYGVLFGARVYGENRLTDAAKERADASVLLYKKQKISKVFVSGDNVNDSEAENLAKYLVANGVLEHDIIIDKMGVDTLNTCKHLQEHGIKEATLITQSFHLPRSLLFCEDKVPSLVGIRANDLGLLETRGSDTFQIYYIRTVRIFRESLLTWSYLLGVYENYSNEAKHSRLES